MILNLNKEIEMVGNIIIEKTWEEVEFFEVSVICSNTNISAKTEVYLTNSLIDELCFKIDSIISLQSNKVVWSSGERGTNSTPCIEFVISSIDMCGHVAIDVYMELNSQGNLNNYHCYFRLDSELGLLYDFIYKLKQLKGCPLGFSISLIDSI